MLGTGIEEEVEICVTIITNETKFMSTNVMKWGRNCQDVEYPPLVPSVEQTLNIQD
jgi:hypothetical protein